MHNLETSWSQALVEDKTFNIVEGPTGLTQTVRLYGTPNDTDLNQLVVSFDIEEAEAMELAAALIGAFYPDTESTTAHDEHGLQMPPVEPAALEVQAPSYWQMLRPKLYPDGNLWCALYGDNIQDGVSGWGETPAEALENFDNVMRGEL